MSDEKHDVRLLITALQRLRKDLRENPDGWQNLTLGDYLESVEAWLEDSQEKLPDEPSWEFVAGLFGVGKIYE